MVESTSLLMKRAGQTAPQVRILSSPLEKPWPCQGFFVCSQALLFGQERRPNILFNLYTDSREEKPTPDSWVVGPVLKIVGEFEKSVQQFPLIPMGTPDPQRIPISQQPQWFEA